MVLSGVLRAVLFLLLSLCLRGCEGQGVDQNTLARIISHIQNVYHPLNGVQYAVAFRIPAESCQEGFIPGEDFPPGNDPVVVTAAYNAIYHDHMMIGAVPQQQFHAEYRLLNPPDPHLSHMQNLLNQGLQPKDCLIFYTYYSPCDGTCLNPANNRNILAALQMFHGHQGPKAFVFNQIFHHPQGLHDHGHDIDNNIWLYRCFPNPDHYECHHCFDHGQLVPACQQ